jgi:allantoin racemase
MRKIAFLMASAATGKLSGELARREKILKEIASEGTQIDMYGLETDPEKSHLGAIQSAYEAVMSEPKTFQVAKAAEADGYQALIISCGGDPGVAPLREIIDVPIVPPGMTAKHICSLLGRRFSILTTGKAGPARIPQIHEKGGLLKLASIHRVGLSVPEVRVKKEEAIEAMIREGKKAVEQHGACSLTFGCMSMGFLMVDEMLTEEIGVPVVNPVKTAVKMAEVYIDLGLTHSPIMYPTPPSLRK